MTIELPKKDIRGFWTHCYYLVNKDIVQGNAMLKNGADVCCVVVNKELGTLLVRDTDVHGEWIVKPEDLEDIYDGLGEEL